MPICFWILTVRSSRRQPPSFRPISGPSPSAPSLIRREASTIPSGRSPRPEDLAGLKLRTMQSPAQVKSWQALGAAPTPIAFAEVYSALQSGVIDGAENQPMFLWNMKHYETIKFLSLTNHMINIGVLAISNRGMNKVPAELRDIIIQSGRIAGDAGRAYDRNTDAEFMDRVKKAGVVVNEVDVRPFVSKLATLHDELAKDFKAENLLKIVREEAAVARGM